MDINSSSVQVERSLMTCTADGHGDCVTRIKARRTIGLKEIHCKIITRNERRLGYRVSEGNNLAKIGPHRRWARTECAIRVLQFADIHPECGVEQILAQDIARD